MADNRPIGILDSGVGGLSVFKELIRLLPHESFFYYADSLHAPYGHKSPAEIKTLTRSVVDFLLEKDCKLIVVACNTATAHAIHFLRSTYTVPFIGMEPAVKPAALHSRTKAIGVLGTRGTLAGNHFKKTVRTYADGIEVISQAGDGLVELVENGQADSDEAEMLLRSYLQPMLERHIDKLVLGCTHYPFLIKRIQKIIGPGVDIIDPAPAVAAHTASVLRQHQLENYSNQPIYRFFNTVDSDILERLAFSVLQQKPNVIQVATK